eukprot:scaffold28610_cov60-Phaeocystis_antarctica.AAC.6
MKVSWRSSSQLRAQWAAWLGSGSVVRVGCRVGSGSGSAVRVGCRVRIRVKGRVRVSGRPRLLTCPARSRVGAAARGHEPRAVAGDHAGLELTVHSRRRLGG